MSSHNTNPPSLVSQGPTDGSTVLSSGPDATAASDGITAHSSNIENQDPNPDVIELYGFATWIGADDDYGLEMDLDYIKGRGCQWTVKLQRYDEFTAERREKTIYLPGLFVDFFKIRQEWKSVELTEQVWAPLRERLWEENVQNSGLDRNILMTMMNKAKSSPSAEEEYARFDRMFHKLKKVEEVREEFAARLESTAVQGSEYLAFDMHWKMPLFVLDSELNIPQPFRMLIRPSTGCNRAQAIQATPSIPANSDRSTVEHPTCSQSVVKISVRIEPSLPKIAKWSLVEIDRLSQLWVVRSTPVSTCNKVTMVVNYCAGNGPIRSQFRKNQSSRRTMDLPTALMPKYCSICGSALKQLPREQILLLISEFAKIMNDIAGFSNRRIIKGTERMMRSINELRSAEKPADPEALRMNWNPNKSEAREISDSLIMQRTLGDKGRITLVQCLASYATVHRMIFNDASSVDDGMTSGPSNIPSTSNLPETTASSEAKSCIDAGSVDWVQILTDSTNIGDDLDFRVEATLYYVTGTGFEWKIEFRRQSPSCLLKSIPIRGLFIDVMKIRREWPQPRLPDLVWPEIRSLLWSHNDRVNLCRDLIIKQSNETNCPLSRQDQYTVFARAYEIQKQEENAQRLEDDVCRVS
ncbi:hypothetical protein HD553DRAFT_324497 [Filobasidium floriforme]|uniref:uncharacterized protein n=1 Tax=Filobasidium floriforme TaxID=5210 RepID=UPI001E8D7DC5|nr:uncharacterized protein HD553DRAFT_324497 [Filobasidium floriforme]KAH8083604.1 hypothetical protein HD553DRAFT_324497 [Filobasidium floriforme]